jgi:hypothetical protein
VHAIQTVQQRRPVRVPRDGGGEAGAQGALDEPAPDCTGNESLLGRSALGMRFSESVFFRECKRTQCDVDGTRHCL